MCRPPSFPISRVMRDPRLVRFVDEPIRLEQERPPIYCVPAARSDPGRVVSPRARRTASRASRRSTPRAGTSVPQPIRKGDARGARPGPVPPQLFLVVQVRRQCRVLGFRQPLAARRPLAWPSVRDATAGEPHGPADSAEELHALELVEGDRPPQLGELGGPEIGRGDRRLVRLSVASSSYFGDAVEVGDGEGDLVPVGRDEPPRPRRPSGPGPGNLP